LRWQAVYGCQIIWNRSKRCAGAGTILLRNLALGASTPWGLNVARLLLAFVAFGDFEGNFLAFLQALETAMLIAEKCAKRSSPPPSGVMKPKPFASLNHLTVPVAIVHVP
jgi:hypothetical protein